MRTVTMAFIHNGMHYNIEKFLAHHKHSRTIYQITKYKGSAIEFQINF